MTTFGPVDPDVGAAVRDAALRYWSTFGWPVRATESEVLLPLRQDMLALTVPATLARQLLETIEAAGTRGSVLSLRGTAMPRWIFLISCPYRWRLLPSRELVVLGEGVDLRLPRGLGRTDPVTWVREPLSADDTLFDGDFVLDRLASPTSTSCSSQVAA